MSRYEHSAELGWKAQSEGGLPDLLYSYGLHMDELPDDIPGSIRAYIRQLLSVKPALNAVQEYLDKAVDDYELRAES